MKTIKMIFTLAIAAFVVNAAHASGNLKVNLASNDVDLTVVEISNAIVNSESISNATMNKVEFEVIDSSGNNLYRMKTTKSSPDFNKRYDFSELEDGIYWYSVRMDKEEVTKKFAIDDGVVEVLDIRKTLEPYFVQDEDFLKISYLNYENENINLYVYDSNNSLLAEANLGRDFSINKAVRLSDLRYGDYAVVITNKNDVYEHQVAIR